MCTIVTNCCTRILGIQLSVVMPGNWIIKELWFVMCRNEVYFEWPCKHTGVVINWYQKW